MEQLIAIIEALAQVVDALVEVSNNQAIAIAALNDICISLDNRVTELEEKSVIKIGKPQKKGSSGDKCSICESGKRCTDARNCMNCKNYLE